MTIGNFGRYQFLPFLFVLKQKEKENTYMAKVCVC